MHFNKYSNKNAQKPVQEKLKKTANVNKEEKDEENPTNVENMFEMIITSWVNWILLTTV